MTKDIKLRIKELHEELQDAAMSPAGDKVENFNRILAEKHALQNVVTTTRRKHSDPCLEAWVSKARGE
jgi:hypothetical protein